MGVAVAVAVDFDLTLEEQCQAIWEATDARHVEMDAIRSTAPLLRLWDGDYKLHHVVQNEDEATFDDPDNDTGPGRLVLDFDTPAAQWIHDMRGRMERGEKRNVHLSVDYCGGRWSGRMADAEVETDERGYSKLIVTFRSDYEELKWYRLWSNPVLPAAIQAPRVFMLGGPAIWVLKTALFLNVLREQTSLWSIPDDPMKLANWTSGLDMSNWTVAIKPTSFLDDLNAGTIWALLFSRWKDWHSASQMILEDAELSVQWRRWFTGDPAPWPGAHLRHGCLVIDIVDKSGVEAGTANGGTLFGGLTRAVRTFTDDFTESIENPLTTLPVVPAYRTPGVLNTDPRVPYVYYTPNSPGVTQASFKQTPATGIQMTTGGHSMPGVNETISAGIQAVGDILGNLFQIGSVGGSVDTMLKPFYEDTILAWIAVKLLERARASGDFRYFEYFIESSGKAYTISSLLAIRAGAFATRTWFSTSVEIQDGAPYLIGDQGKGHFWKGDRIVVAVKGDLNRRMHVDRVSQLTLSWSRGQRPAYAITVGNANGQEDPIARLAARLEHFKAGMQELGAF